VAVAFDTPIIAMYLWALSPAQLAFAIVKKAPKAFRCGH
jgi:hypothetical protein